MKKPDIELVKSLFERAVYDCSEREGPVKELEEVWDEYFAFAVRRTSLMLHQTNVVMQTATPKKFVNLVNIADRAVRSCPASGLLWANHFRVSVSFPAPLSSLADCLAGTIQARCRCCRGSL